jgi:hypothetical protein
MSVVYFIRKHQWKKAPEETNFRRILLGELPFSIDVKGGERTTFK